MVTLLRQSNTAGQLRTAGITALALGQFRPAPGRMTAPDVCCDIVWARGKVTLTGPVTHARPSSNVGHDVTLLRLDPLVVHRWLRTPLSCLTDQSVNLYDIDPRLAGVLDEIKSEGRLARLVQPIGRLATDVDPRMIAATQALRCGKSVGQTASLVALSERQLARLFSEQTGLAPKAFARILRMRSAIGAAKAGASLAAAAFIARYADQAHFSRDVRALTGVSPSEALRNVGNVQDIVVGAI